MIDLSKINEIVMEYEVDDIVIKVTLETRTSKGVFLGFEFVYEAADRVTHIRKFVVDSVKFVHANADYDEILRPAIETAITNLRNSVK